MTLTSAVADAQAPVTRVSVSSGGVAGNSASDHSSISADGRVVAFASTASNLISGDGNAVADVFVHDRQTGQTTRVSVATSGLEANGASQFPAISADGRFVAFYSEATTLVGSDSNGSGDIFVHDRQVGQTSRVSVATGGRQIAGVSPDPPSISGDGRYVGFSSNASDVVIGDTNATGDVFLHDQVLGETIRVSATGAGLQADDWSYRVAVAAGGNHVAFLSYARNLVPGGDGGLTPDVFVWSRLTLQHTRVRIPFEARFGSVVSDISTTALSADGRLLVFSSIFPDGPVAGTEPVALSVFAHELDSGRTTTVATRTLTLADPLFGRASISRAGAKLAFAASDAPGCSPSGTPGTPACPRHIFVHDLSTGGTSRADVPATVSTDEGSSSSSPAISPDGAAVVFASDSRVLLPGALDTNQVRDVFVRDLRSDTDGDGIPDAVETQYGLNPQVNDATADPDGDGRSNAQEIQAGTHPRGFVTRYLAEGATSSFFDTSVALVNPSPTTSASVLLRFLTGTGGRASRVLTVPAMGRRTVDVKTVPGLAVAEFSTVIESDTRVVVDRTMRWDRNGYGSHAETAIDAPALTWYFAEGATHSGFKLFYLIQNPEDRAATVEVTYLLPAPAAPLVKTYTVAAQSRVNIWVNNEGVTDGSLSALRSTDVSAIVRSTNGVPVIAERAMYLDGARTFGAGHESAGVTAPAARWFLAEGATGAYFDLFVLVANPGDQPAEIRATFLLPTGDTLVKSYRVPGRSRFNIWVDEERFPDAAGQRLLADTAVSTTIESTNGVPIIVERSMWWPGPTAATWHEAHNSPGATDTATRWALAEGELGGQHEIETYILIANTSAIAGSARVTLLFEDGTTTTRTFLLLANSRFNVSVASEFPEAAQRRFGALVESIGNAPVAIVVERAMYSNSNGVTWAAGTNALGSRLQP